ncbi:gfo/Idh/MocA family oxidoreductase [Pseudarthrobacter phenanthrenivorans]|uniref:Gfo/Idh/MocA family oxidoreductase n=1 Tax=Pseudarthrobacter phenanthrenivorans TaxID=361575 RepID=A0A3B0FUF8_PSEPS|nr:Gfo/Idh/MocA family oxidoreductase [Pseudarthrobacter phenanthrenivorans]RKO23459.1 gfo/Idh/MocA family oxidoreductase [Pseudarthrobacter phenanthrenivorans]TPV50994.1 Gfo/Idh/MocA family oxidoreductase [Pseudarthrobacter phenanthrenivorans]
MPWNVGILGAGPGVAALHLPVLGRLAGTFSVVHIADAGSGRARELAERVGARWSEGEAEVLVDPSVDAVLICSPPADHARQILAALAAGKRAIFCEKPLATSRLEAEDVILACRAAGAVLLVGTNHLFDAAWGRARHHLVALEGKVQSISVTLALPPNDRYHRLVAEGGPFQAGRRGRPDLGDPAVAAGVLRQLLTGLAVHDLPAVRDIAPGIDEIVYARLTPPVGYLVGYRAGGVLVQLALTMLPAGPDALWRMSICTTHDRIEVNFPPAFVHAGSAATRVRSVDGQWTEYRRDEEDGYVSEWRLFASLLEGDAPVEYDELLADSHYAIDLADVAAAKMLEGARE